MVTQRNCGRLFNKGELSERISSDGDALVNGAPIGIHFFNFAGSVTNGAPATVTASVIADRLLINEGKAASWVRSLLETGSGDDSFWSPLMPPELRHNDTYRTCSHFRSSGFNVASVQLPGQFSNICNHQLVLRSV